MKLMSSVETSRDGSDAIVIVPNQLDFSQMELQIEWASKDASDAIVILPDQKNCTHSEEASGIIVINTNASSFGCFIMVVVLCAMDSCISQYKMLCWNVRGLNNYEKHEDIRKVISSLKPDLLYI
jgi:hypothetical protein